MTIKINKKSVVMTAKDGGKYRLDLTNMKIYDVTEKGKIRAPKGSFLFHRY